MRWFLHGCVLSVSWAALIGAGFYFMLRHENTPACPTGTPAHWPADSALVPDPARATLVVALHPRCPCTRATLAELEELGAERPAALSAHVLVYKPRGSLNGWEQTDLWRRVIAIPGVQVRTDEDGIEAGRFGASASGHVFLYDATGVLLFNGGLTSARGHAGESVGRRTISALLAGKKAAQTETPVYGCSLITPLSFTTGCQECKK